MVKKEIAEIKKTLNPKHAAIWRIAGCFVDTDKSISPVTSQDFHRLPEEEGTQYLSIFSKTLSGAIGKTLHTVEFPTDAEKEGSGHSLLMEIRKSKLKDEKSLQALSRRIVDTYQNEDAYCILVMYAEYDVPVKKEDLMGDIGDSDTVFPHMIFAICPAVQSKPALSYKKQENRIADAVKNILISPPSFGFLFPAFHDRASDIHAMLCYTKKQSDSDDAVIHDVFGCIPPVPPEQMQEGFSAVVSASLGDNCTFENVTVMQEKVMDIGGEELGKEDLFAVLSSCGSATQKKDYDGMYEEALRGNPVPLNQAAPPKSIVKAGSFTLTCPAEILSLVAVKEIDGRPCLVIAPDGDIQVNGMPIV